MTFEHLKKSLKEEGIWRCEIVENLSLDPGRIGVLELYFPKTVSKAKIKKIISNYIPAALKVEVKKMENPLRRKKHTYTLRYI